MNKKLFCFILFLSVSQVEAQIDLQLEPVTNDASQPVLVTHAGDGSGRIFVVERRGKIRIMDASGTFLASPFLDVGSSGLNLIDIGFTEQGLLGLAFHPDYENNGRFFLNYTRTDGDTIVSEWQVSEDPNIAYATSESVILGPVDQPEDNHNGGALVFGPTDGYLYISFGDGGSGGDPHGAIGNGQNPNTILGSILRIDVDSGSPYSVPADNPFVGMAGFLDEIFAYGFRNPWRMSFDRGGTHQMYVADVGQNIWEEVSIVEGGKNYGWRCFEGTHDYNPSNCGSATEFVDPVAEYNHSSGRCSVTGGYVYRGPSYPSLQGMYFFADYCSGDIWSLVETSPGTYTMTAELDAPFNISAFGEDEAGEVYVCGYNQNNGAGPTTIYRLIDANQIPAPEIDVDSLTLAFDEQQVGTESATMTLTISNVGTDDLTFTSIALTSGDTDQFGFDSPPDTSALPSSHTREIDLKFNPTSEGVKNAILSIDSNDPDEPTVEIQLTGTGTEGPSSVSRWRIY
ncbi:MAG: PQQ-dependent sugar dehydrogenase [Candidatus Omnitrophica bacterium]|nr:PQQ-dependent sugar dehydrogenase [Candidatus Omnitrophota bacterium]